MNQRQSKCYSIIPAAGRSQRMGCQKLLLPWPSNSDPVETAGTVFDSVLNAWENSQVHEIVVVLRDSDSADHQRLLKICSKYRVHVVGLEDPPDMKASVIGGIRFLQENFQPTQQDRCFISPADIPTINSLLIDKLVGQELRQNQSCVPFFGKEKGHPGLLNWQLLNSVFDLRDDQGINKIIESSDVVPIHFSANERVPDIDTPEDYEQLGKQQN